MSNLTAISIRDQVEVDRQTAHAEVDERYDSLLRAISAAYGVGNLSVSIQPKAKKPASKTRLKAADPVVEETRTDAIPPPPMTDSSALEEEGEAFYDACTQIRQFLLTNPGAGKAAILLGTQLTENEYNNSMKYMLDEGRIRKEGEKRGSKYFLTVDGSTFE